jgi:hypothetical protein
VGRAGFGELFMQGKHSLHQGDNAGALGRSKYNYSFGIFQLNI